MALIDDKTLCSEFESFYYNNRIKGMRTAFSVLHNDALAEEAVSESFLRLAKSFQKVHNLGSHDLVSHFVITVRNTSLNMLKKEPEGELEYDDNMDHTELPDADEQLLKECMAILPEGDRELLFMRYTLCLGSREIGAALGISDEAARKRVQYGGNGYAERRGGSFRQRERIQGRFCVIPHCSRRIQHFLEQVFGTCICVLQ